MSEVHTYTKMVTATSPAFIVYLIDISSSMHAQQGQQIDIDVVHKAFERNMMQLLFLSTRGHRVSPRYHIAILAYNQKVYDLIDGIQPIDKVFEMDIPPFVTDADASNDTYTAFLTVEEMLHTHLHRYEASPPPLVCHVTSGAYAGQDPTEVINRIRGMRVKDGNVLVEHIYVNNMPMLVTPPHDVRQWSGVTLNTEFTDNHAGRYAQKLREMSSPIPLIYQREAINRKRKYSIASDAIMLFPAHDVALLDMGFEISIAK